MSALMIVGTVVRKKQTKIYAMIDINLNLKFAVSTKYEISAKGINRCNCYSP